MIVVMRHADQRHALGKAELAAEDFRRARHLVEAAAVEAGGLRGAQQLQALRQLLQHRARQRAGQRRIIPAGQPGVDVAGVASDAAQRCHHRVDRGARIFRGVLVAGKALFLVVDDQARAVRLRHLDQRHAGIMRAGRAEAGEIDGFAARELCRGRREARIGECRAELMKARQRPWSSSPASARREIRRRRVLDVADQFVCSVPSRGPWRSIRTGIGAIAASITIARQATMPFALADIRACLPARARLATVGSK